MRLPEVWRTYLWQEAPIKKPDQFLVSEAVRLQAKDGIRTRDIHLGKVELYP